MVVAAVAVATPAVRPDAAVAAPGDEPVMTMYVPFDEQGISDSLFSIYPAGIASRTDVVSTISITSAADGAIIYWDHWEDGYDADPATAPGPTTQVWGDEDAANGIRPTAADAAGDIIAVGDVIFLQNPVALPRDATDVVFDGRDRVSSTRGFSMARAGWDAGLGPAHAGAVAATDTSKFGTQFDIPVGEDAGFGAFDYTGVSVMVAADATTVEVDLGGDGTVDRTELLDRGETVFIDGGVTVGTTVATTGPAQVHLITGRRASRYEGRWFEVFPAETLDDEYVAAAGTVSASQPVTIFVYNPGDESIDVVADAAGTTDDQTLTVAPRSVVAYDLPAGSGAHFTSPGNPFSALSGTVANGGSTVAYDWGYSLVPVSSLTPTVFVGWGAGNPSGDASNSPVWVAPLTATTIYVDSDNDGTPEQTFTGVDAFESVRIVDPSHDLTGARIYTTDGTLLSVAWGQDAALRAGDAFDLGTAVLPTAALITTKSAALAVDIGGDGVVDPGDTIEYTIRNFDAGAQALTELVVVDDLPVELVYVAGSTRLGGVPVDDDSSGTPFPLDGTGFTIALLDPGATNEIVFRASLATVFPFGVDQIINEVFVSATQTESTARSITPVRPISPASITGFVWADGDADGILAAGEVGIDQLSITLVGPSHRAGTTTIANAGRYTFDDLVPGVYSITIDRGPTSTLPPDAFVSAGSEVATVTLTSGQSAAVDEVGYVLPGSISGSVFEDADADGRRDAGERPFAGVALTVTGPGIAPAGVAGVTRADGSYTFSDLDAGVHVVSATPGTGDLPNSFVATLPEAGHVTVSSTTHVTDIDLGWRDPTVPLSQLSGLVWHDRNANGRLDAIETVLDGVSIRLLGCDDTGSPRVAVAVTEAVTGIDGRYRFDGLGSGCHRVSIDAGTTAEFRTFTHDADGGADGGADGIADVEVISPTPVGDVDFGVVNLVPAAGTDRMTVDEGDSDGAQVTPLDNDTDPEGRPLSITAVSDSPNGAASISGDTITYVPRRGFDGADYVTYSVCDPAGGCATGVVTIVVTNTNDPPQLTDADGRLDVVIGQPVPALGIVDAEGDAVTVTLADGNLPAGVTLNSDGSFTGTPTATGNRPGDTSTAVIQLCDDRGACVTVELTLTARAAASTGGTGTIASTGADTQPLLVLAAAFTVLGFGLLWSVRVGGRSHRRRLHRIGSAR